MINQQKEKILTPMKSKRRKYAEDDDRQTILFRYRIPKHTYELIKKRSKEQLIKPNEFIHNILEDYHTETIGIWSNENLNDSLSNLSSGFCEYFKSQSKIFIEQGIVGIEELQMELSKSVQYVTSEEEFVDGNIRVREIIYKTIKEYSALFNRSINAELLIRIDHSLHGKKLDLEKERENMKIIIFKIISDGFIDKIKNNS